MNQLIFNLAPIAILILIGLFIKLTINTNHDRKKEKFTVIKSATPKKHKRIIYHEPPKVDPRYEDCINAMWDEVNK